MAHSSCSWKHPKVQKRVSGGNSMQKSSNWNAISDVYSFRNSTALQNIIDIY